jgi:two-component system C4-dicarboxylate transport response regulator DctD
MMQFERNLLEQTLRETAGRKGEAAKLLMIPRKRLYLRLKSVGLLKTGHN